MVHTSACINIFSYYVWLVFWQKDQEPIYLFLKLENYLELFKDLRKDETVPKIATNLVYLIKANRKDQVESKVIYSIFSKQPKRADKYWLLHVDSVDEPNRFEYNVNQIIPGFLSELIFI